MWIGEVAAKGYEKADFEEVWHRYLSRSDYDLLIADRGTAKKEQANDQGPGTDVQGAPITHLTPEEQMNANELKNDSAAELRRVAIVEMFNCFKENLLPPAPGQEAERATRMIDTLKLCVQALETLPGNKVQNAPCAP